MNPHVANKLKQAAPFLLGFVAALLYLQSIHYQFTWDDQLVITENEVTQKGVAGIAEIWTKPSYISQRKIYRPVPQTVQALAWSISPNNPKLFHLINILCYGLCVAVFFIFLSQLFKRFSPWIIGFIALLFALSPLHVEVVANVKSLDELLAFLLATLASISLLSGLRKGSFWYFLAVLFFTMALLSKLSAITFLPVIVVIIYYTSSFKAPKSLTSLFKKWGLSLQEYVKKDAFNVVSLLLLILLTILTAFGGYYSLYILFALGLSLIILLTLTFRFFPFFIAGSLIALLLFSLFDFTAFAAPFLLLFGVRSHRFFKKGIVWLVIFHSWLAIVEFTLYRDLGGIAAIAFLFIFNLIYLHFGKTRIVSILYFTVAIVVFFLTKELAIFPIVLLITSLFLIVENFTKRKTQPYFVGLVLLFLISLGVKNDVNYYSINSLDETNLSFSYQTDETVQTPITPIHNTLFITTNNQFRSATIATIQLKYLQLLAYPKTLIHQYGYNQIPLTDWYDWKAWLSVLLHLLLMALAIYGLIKKAPWAFGILWYLATISIYTNIIRLMPDTLAERFLFTPSAGFIIALVFGLHAIFNRFVKSKAVLLTGIVLLPIGIFWGYKTFTRTKAWESNYTLAAMTVKLTPNNAAINAQYASEVRKLFIANPDTSAANEMKIAIQQHFERAIEIYPNFYSANADLGAFLLEEGNPIAAEPYLQKASEIRPNAWLNHYYLGFIAYDAKDWQRGISEFKAALSNPSANITQEEYVQAAEFLARCFYNTQDLPSAQATLTNLYDRYQSKSSLILLANMQRQSGQINQAIITFEYLLLDYPTDMELRQTIEILEQEL